MKEAVGIAIVFVLCCLECSNAEAQTHEAKQALRILCPKRVDLAPHFDRAAARYQVPAALLVSIARNESRCSPSATGKLGEAGLGQIKPGTIAAGKVSTAHLYRASTNVMLIARHLRRCLRLCGDYQAALGVYAGHRTCPAGRASGYAKRVLELWERAKGAKRS